MMIKGILSIRTLRFALSGKCRVNIISGGCTGLWRLEKSDDDEDSDHGKRQRHFDGNADCQTDCSADAGAGSLVKASSSRKLSDDCANEGSEDDSRQPKKEADYGADHRAYDGALRCAEFLCAKHCRPEIHDVAE